MNSYAGMPLADEGGDAPVLNEDRVGREAAEEGKEGCGAFKLLLKDYRIKGYIEPHGPFSGVSVESTVFQPIEIASALTRGEFAEPQIEGIGPSLDRRDGGFEASCRQEKLGTGCAITHGASISRLSLSGAYL